MSVKTPAPKRNDTVKDVQRWTESYATSKQSGRRYGPSPKMPQQRVSTPPMTMAHRREIYWRGGRPTDRQMNQLYRMAARNGEEAGTLFRDLGNSKGRPTAKRVGK